jgi:chemotaxis response regulator CheB
MAGRDIVVIGASAGGVTALRRLLPSLPRDFRATVFVALHRWPHENPPDSLPDLLALDSPLTPRPAVNGKKFAPGEIYVAPADTHLMVDRGVIRLECSPRESHAPPSVDALFQSAAMAYGRRVVGVVLTGMLDDGTAGLWQIRKYGGIAIVQDPAEAEDAAARSGIENVPVHYSLPLEEIAWMLGALAAEPPSAPEPIGAKYARLLVVEDGRIVANDLANRLQRLGYSVVGSVSSGEEAIGTAAATMPDLVLMDVSLAGKMRGTEAAQILWQQYQLPVVFVTAYSDEQTLDEAKQSMPYGYIVKPYSPDQIRAAIELALDRYGRVMDVSVQD